MIIRDLKFYYMDRCPFCIKVMRYMEKNDIEVEMINISEDPKHEEDLVRIGGNDQVPMLLIDGDPLYESSDIIQWFKDAFVNKKVYHPANQIVYHL